jgi:hypothetical protein
LSSLETAGLTIFILILFVGLFTIIFGLPGTVVVEVDAFVYSLFTGFETIGLKIIFVLLIISVIAEGVDFALVVAGIVRFGVTKRRLLSVSFGSAIGAVMLTPPLLGVGAVIGLFLGGFSAMLIEELIWQNKLRPSLRTGSRVILGRALGTLLKGMFCLVMIVITLSKVYS